MLEQLRIQVAICVVHADAARSEGNCREASAWRDAARKLKAAIKAIRIAPSYRRQDENERTKRAALAPSLNE